MLAALIDALLENQPRPLLTAVYAHLGPGFPAELELAAGGHPLPILVRASGTVEAIGKPGTLLGFAAVPELHDVRHELGAGDAIVLYTDGVIETRPIERALGPDGLAELLGQCAGWSAEAIVELIEHVVEERSEGRQVDDLAVLVLRVVPR